MESHDLRIFKHVAELQSISKAAEKLDYVQSNISQRIKSLEDELGVQLFTRNNRGVTLTGEGKELLGYANQILLLLDEARSSVNPAKWKESLTIGAPQTISAVRIPQLFSSFLINHPLDLKLKTNTSQRLQEMLSYGELDGIFVNAPYDHLLLESVYTYYENVGVIFSKINPLKKSLNQTIIINSDPSCVYRSILLDLIKQRNMQNPVIMEFDSLESIVQAVVDGLGISVIPADIIHSRKEFHSIEYEELPDTIRIDFVIKKRKKQAQALRKFIDFLVKS